METKPDEKDDKDKDTQHGQNPLSNAHVLRATSYEPQQGRVRENPVLVETY